MFIITFENHYRKQWLCDFEFDSLEDAKEYLVNDGFKGNGYMYERGNRGWSTSTKAYIKGMKLYKK